MPKVAVIVVAAGKGERFGGSEKKTFAKIRRSAGLQPPWRKRLADRLR